MSRIEVQHNTEEQVKTYVSTALSLVELLEVPEDLRVAAFTQAVSLLSSKTVQVVQPAPGILPHMAIPRGN